MVVDFFTGATIMNVLKENEMIDEILNLLYYTDLTYEEIAAEVGCSIGLVVDVADDLPSLNEE